MDTSAYWPLIPGLSYRTAKIYTISRDESPISIEDEGFQLPVFPRPRFAQPYNVGALCETTVPGQVYKIQAQTLVDQEFDHAFILLWRGCAVFFL